MSEKNPAALYIRVIPKQIGPDSVVWFDHETMS